MSDTVIRESIEIGGKTLTLETGHLAKQANSSVLVSYADTVVLVTTILKKANEQRDFLPLLVEYREQMYAAGKIPGGYIKREGKPHDREILMSRGIDRAIRPRFPQNMIDEVEVIAFLLSYDMENDPLTLGIIGASAALMISEIPFDGPIGAVKLGRINGNYVLNPTNTDMAQSDVDILLTGSNNEINMIEFWGKEIPENEVLTGIKTGLAHIAKTEELQRKFAANFNKEKVDYTKIIVSQELYNDIEAYADRLSDAIFCEGKLDRKVQLSAIEEEISNLMNEKYPDSEIAVKQALMDIEEKIFRSRVLETGKRPDGRSEKDIRPITCEISVLPRTHGSALFTRGETQALVATTLGTKGDVQKLSEMELEEEKRFILHYNFPPFSTGELKPLRGPSRRELGHGNLSEKAIKSVIPPENDFPYTIRVVSDILESNGSSSMATVCGATLSLMDAGVPIENMVAGISTGLVEENGKYRLLTDILGLEDHFGDMDFKVAGTDRGITAIQLDLKRKGIKLELIEETFERAKESRLAILEKMRAVISKPRSTVSRYAPKVAIVPVPHEKIGIIIGPGGKMIHKIMEETDTNLEIDDKNSTVTISGTDEKNVKDAKDMVLGLVEEVKRGKIYRGKVVKIVNFGAFVEVLPGKEGLLHISELANRRVAEVKDVVNEGDIIPVKVIDIDNQGRIKLSLKRAKEELEENNKRTE